MQCSKDHKANHCPATTKSTTESDAQSTAISNNSGSTIAVQQSKYLPSKELISTAQPKRKRKFRESNDDDSDNDEPGWQITQQMKQQISQSKWIRNELKDGGLRQLIDSIDCASDVDDEDDGKPHDGYKGQQQKKDNNKISPRVLALARAKHRHPKFASFIDEMLLTAGVLQPASGGVDGCGGERLANILEGQGGRGPLVLAPVPRRGADDVNENKSSSNESEDNSGESDSDSSSNDDSEEESSDSNSSEEDSESEGEVKE